MRQLFAGIDTRLHASPLGVSMSSWLRHGIRVSVRGGTRRGWPPLGVLMPAMASSALISMRARPYGIIGMASLGERLGHGGRIGGLQHTIEHSVLRQSMSA